ncbi:exo-beta-N-acetylmuramidase NamZ domain-containing protein [Enhydrobacter aerosaccus]|uniref:exo-beta-N-acetylmuramidase NamZ domain-containing protein n=1 Tax=Enhydrobacter aerosaccus TaxID=225324 RepID=UPI0014833740|nr:exo-beta-N-acetylmuramidase NamZ domain-containing protein [Enhydrobacter aerosaccus]
MCQVLISCAAPTTPVAAAPTVTAGAEEISSIVREEIAAGHLPGAVIVVGVHDRIVLRQAYGDRSVMPERQPATLDTIYDAASLTKVMATAVAIEQLVEQGKISLDRPAASYWPAFAANGKAEITVRQLLTHYADLPAGLSSRGWSDREGALEAAASVKPVAPPGSRFLYSDIDFIVLGEIVRRVSGQPLETYSEQHIFRPLGMSHTGFLPSPNLRERIAPADVEGGELRWGQVQDPTAYRMGGVAGHAGVFTTADDLTRFARMMIGDESMRRQAVLRPESIAAMTRPQSPPGQPALRGLGWDIDSPYSDRFSPFFSTRSFGHTGYTGTAIWIDPETRSFLIVLSNRLHPDGRGDILPMLRRIARVAGAMAVAGARPQTQSGIDVVEAYGFRQFAGRRIGLVSNGAARDSAGRRTADVLRQGSGMNLVALFSPEHGFDASAEGRIASGTDRATGLPVYSLYGDTRRPTDAMLAGLDALVFDMQDVGTRYYTYATTMAYAMEAAAQRKLDFYVLDRPDPITASTVQGPVLDPGLTSFVSYMPLPTRHGMTMGELARLFNAEKKLGTHLHLVRMRRYDRRAWFDQTGFSWVPPSPNLRRLDEAVLYPGVAMVEGANVSVGRGTESPFELLGAPWIDGKTLAAELTARAIPGVRFEATTFTPTESAFAGESCQGVRLHITDRNRLDTPLLGVELAAALHRLYGDRFAIDRILGLLGSRQSLDAIKANVDPREIASTWQPALDGFRLRRETYLIY